MATTMPKIAIGDHNRAETVSEEMRILYVAMTRPKEKLILVDSVTSGEVYGMEHSEQFSKKHYTKVHR